MPRAFAAVVAALVTVPALAEAPAALPTAPCDVPVVSYAELDPATFELRAGLGPGTTALQLRDAALRAVAPPLSRSLRVVMSGEPEADVAPKTVTIVAEGLADDAVASELTELVFDRRGERWFVARARRALLCRRGAVTDRFVRGPCP